MELRHLRYFVAVAEHMNFRRAAEHLQMTQPPLSQQIKQLERELGFDLFHRQGRSIELTPAGATFLHDARRVLAQVERGVEHARSAARGHSGKLRIGFVGTVAYTFLPRILRRFRVDFPAVEVTLHELPSSRQIDALHNTQIDIGLCRMATTATPQIHTEVIYQEGLCAVLPREHPLSAKPDLSLADLQDEAFVLFPPYLGAELHTHILRVCAEFGFTPTVRQHAIQMTTIVGLVAAGIGVSVLPRAVMTLPHQDVHYRPLEKVAPVNVYSLWRRDTRNPVLRHFLEAISED